MKCVLCNNIIIREFFIDRHRFEYHCDCGNFFITTNIHNDVTYYRILINNIILYSSKKIKVSALRESPIEHGEVPKLILEVNKFIELNDYNSFETYENLYKKLNRMAVFS